MTDKHQKANEQQKQVVPPQPDGKRQKDQQNEGEGNRTAAREFNQKQQDFAKSGRVEEAAEEAREALEGREGEELEVARKQAASRAREHDPAEQRDYDRAKDTRTP